MKILRMPDPAEMEKEKQINGLCKELHIMPPPVLRLKAEVFLDGEKISHYEDRARSWVRNYYNFMTMQTLGLTQGELGTTYGTGTAVMRRTSGADDASTSYNTSARYSASGAVVGTHYRAAAGSTSHGIVVGTSTTAESFECFGLQALIANGTGAGQMSYAAMDAPTTTWSGATKKFTQEIIRYINNNSGGSITVNEAGLACILYTAATSGSTTQNFLLARDLVSPGVAVPNTAQLKVTYTIESATYPV